MHQPFFLEGEFSNTEWNEASFHIIPVPLEETVTYGKGTSNGPIEIIKASTQLEQLIEGYGNPGTLGIHTADIIDRMSFHDLEELFNHTARIMDASLNAGGLPILLGGEHSITNGAIRFIENRFEKGKVGIIQFDAHMDLRDTYRGSKWNHACVMHRAVEIGIPLYQVGIRSFSQEELESRECYSVLHADASSLYGQDITALTLPECFPKQLYISFDVDCFDASIMGATGTPEPGGLLWWDAITALGALTQGCTILGADVVELAPADMLHHCNYTAAKLTYAIMALAAQRNGWTC
ncbi:MAG: agmatinase [Sphaerochaetaceae bacterium]|jgi:agmatinase|nr:agmatinase [Sphaerochaetaceae bacterium]MDX9809757.1 agmatinase [Sphaerochaetaceae bacterium]NLV83292.1 agmatinase [Spirochaetales bacterium]